MNKRDLPQTMRDPYKSEINCGISSFWDAGFTAWIGDDMNGHKAERGFGEINLHDAAEWLHSYAIQLYPYSAYAKAAADAEPHFDISDDGVMFALPTWKRDNQATSYRLLLTSIDEVPPEVVATWSDEQVKAADVWACSVHLNASDNEDIKVPPKPAFLPPHREWQPTVPGTIL